VISTHPSTKITIHAPTLHANTHLAGPMVMPVPLATAEKLSESLNLPPLFTYTVNAETSLANPPVPALAAASHAATSASPTGIVPAATCFAGTTPGGEVICQVFPTRSTCSAIGVATFVCAV